MISKLWNAVCDYKDIYQVQKCCIFKCWLHSNYNPTNLFRMKNLGPFLTRKESTCIPVLISTGIYFIPLLCIYYFKSFLQIHIQLCCCFSKIPVVSCSEVVPERQIFYVLMFIILMNVSTNGSPWLTHVLLKQQYATVFQNLIRRVSTLLLKFKLLNIYVNVVLFS